jgi:hypothetical protein
MASRSGSVGETAMGVVVEHRDLFDLRKKALIDLNVGAGEGFGLRPG